MSVVYLLEVVEFLVIDLICQIVFMGNIGLVFKDIIFFVIWEVEDSNIVVVNLGKIQVKGNGMIVVKVEYGDFKIYVLVIVVVYNEGVVYLIFIGI